MSHILRKDDFTGLNWQVLGLILYAGPMIYLYLGKKLSHILI